MRRIFIALKIPEYIRKEIISYRIKAYPGYQNFKWEPINKLHITLKFIGDIKNDTVDKIIDALGFISNYKTLNCSLDKFGFFYWKKEPKILWLGLKANPELNTLVEDINIVLEKVPILKDERNFKAHLTLLRIKQSVQNNFIESFENYKIPEVNFVADEIAVMESKLLPQGSKYKDIKILKLN
ncbi:MAG TPA: RNA 2',3'-cyclic phosphodiesterase [Ignavibacteria bacterium]|nr:RNA 2',3'-cyclic phosphodiesterase [Ignavibacteria bacterium]